MTVCAIYRYTLLSANAEMQNNPANYLLILGFSKANRRVETDATDFMALMDHMLTTSHTALSIRQGACID